MTVRAQAHPNIALVKYWGKADGPGNVPATPSLSLTLSGFCTQTSVRTSDTGGDVIQLNGAVVRDAKIEQWLTRLRAHFRLPTVHIETGNNFPTASGLASSASGFAALITALNRAFDLGLDRASCSAWARQGSASAARSLFGGYVTLAAPDWQAQSLAPTEHWPLEVVVAVTATGPKGISSTEGMRASKATAPYFDAWTQQTAADFPAACAAVAQRDFDALAQIVETSCLRMHALMLATDPPLLYWQPGTLAAIHELRALRRDGLPVCYTIDAGPQVK
ncbi:MAG: diphosphomevalonate decarboxylase, partial [Pseudomonadota bacterium]